MIGAIVSLVTGGLAAYKQHNQNKANELKRKDEMKQASHNKKMERLQSGDEQAASLDHLSIKERGFKDELLMLLFVPLILCFFPDYAPHVKAGFESLKEIPEPYWWVIGAIVVDILGMRSMVRYLLEFFSHKFRGK